MSKFLDVALEAAKKAEEIILKNYQVGVVVNAKADSTPVTIADTEAEEIIISTIRSHFPDHSFLGEESGEASSGSDYLWIIDPIDGTKNYSRNIPLFGTQIALMEKGKIILGVSNMPALHEMLYAESGSGAFLNGNPVSTSAVTNLADGYMAYGGINYFKKQGLLENLLALEQQTRGHRGLGDCWMYHLLAQGKIDIVLEAAIKIWDIAAASIIVSEAGGKVTDLRGEPVGLETTSFLATNRGLYEEVSLLFKK